MLPVVRYRRKLKNGVQTMPMTTFILIVGLVLLTMAAINEAIALLVWLYEQDRKRKGGLINGKEKQ